MNHKSLLLGSLLISTVLAAGCSFFQQDQPEILSISNKSVILPQEPDKKSTAITGFITTNDRWAKYPTEVQLQKTENGFQIEFTCFWNIKNAEWSEKKTDDDTTLFGGEHIEIQISPNGLKDGIYYHFAVNPEGSVYHAKKTDTSWTPADFTCEIEKLDNCWKVLCNIPYATVGQTAPAPDAKWKVNFCRGGKEKNSPPEFSSWTGSSNFHDITFMGTLFFSGKQPDQQLRVYRCELNDEGKLEVEFQQSGEGDGFLQVFDQGNLIASEKITGTDRKTITCKLKDDYATLKNLRHIDLYYAGKLRIPIQSFNGSIRTAEQDFLLLDKMEYINAKTMKCSVASAPGKLLIKKENSVIRVQDVPAADQAEISLEGLEPGRYVAEYSSKGKRTSRVFFIAPETIAEPAPYPENAKLTIKGKDLFLNDQPYFLFGISEGNKKNFPIYPGYSYSYGPGARKNAVTVRGFPISNMIRKPVVGRAFVNNWEERTIKHLESTKKIQKPLWNRIAYEANLFAFLRKEDGSLEKLSGGDVIYEKVYKIAKEMIPDGVFVLHVDNISVVRDFAPICDVLEFATWKSSYHPDNMMKYFQIDLNNIQAIAGEKPIIVWLGGSIPNPTCRTTEELRAGVYATILNGGAGNTVHMGHGGISPERTRFWSMLSMIQREIDSFFADLKTWQKTDVKFPENTIGQAVISPEGELLVVILNNTMNELNITLDLPEKYGKQNFILTPLEPRVLRFNPVPETTEKTAEKKEESSPAPEK